LRKIKERVKQLNEQPPKPKTKEQQMNFGILKSSETPLVKTKGVKPAQSERNTIEQKMKP
jgi:hypothetical protein